MSAPNAGLPPHLKATEVRVNDMVVFVFQSGSTLLFFLFTTSGSFAIRPAGYYAPVSSGWYGVALE